MIRDRRELLGEIDREFGLTEADRFDALRIPGRLLYGAPSYEAELPARGTKDYVRWVQVTLNQVLGLGLAADGAMGPQTRNAVREFQRRQGLAADGVVGPRTEAALLAAAGGG